MNQQLPEWLRFSGEERLRLEGFVHKSYRPDGEDEYLLHRFRLTSTIQPVSWFKAVFQVQDTRVFFQNAVPAPSYQATWDLRFGYGEFGELGKSPIAVRVGRQEMIFGTERLIGAANWSNTTRYFDAVRAAMVYRKWRVDAFAASVVVQHDGQVGSVTPGNNIHGLYGSLGGIVPGGTIEPYFLWRLQPRVKTETGPVANLDMKVSGFRWFGKARAFDYDTSLVIERGFAGADHIEAWAGHWLAGYTFRNAQWKPRIYAEYALAVGDGNPKDGQRNGFELLYTNAHDRLGLADQFGWKNIRQARLSAQFQVSKKFTLTPSHNLFWLDNPKDALYTWQGAVIARRADGSAGRFVGQETDIVLAYRMNSIVDLGAGIAHITPGHFLKVTTPGLGLTFPYFMMTTRF